MCRLSNVKDFKSNQLQLNGLNCTQLQEKLNRLKCTQNDNNKKTSLLHSSSISHISFYFREWHVERPSGATVKTSEVKSRKWSKVCGEKFQTNKSPPLQILTNYGPSSFCSDCRSCTAVVIVVVVVTVVVIVVVRGTDVKTTPRSINKLHFLFIFGKNPTVFLVWFLCFGADFFFLSFKQKQNRRPSQTRGSSTEHQQGALCTDLSCLNY